MFTGVLKENSEHPREREVDEFSVQPAPQWVAEMKGPRHLGSGRQSALCCSHEPYPAQAGIDKPAERPGVERGDSSHRPHDTNRLAPPPRVDVVEDHGCGNQTRRDRVPCNDRQPARRHGMFASVVGRAEAGWRSAHQPEVCAAG
jgi:hypothetical protein